MIRLFLGVSVGIGVVNDDDYDGVSGGRGACSVINVCSLRL